MQNPFQKVDEIRDVAVKLMEQAISYLVSQSVPHEEAVRRVKANFEKLNSHPIEPITLEALLK